MERVWWAADIMKWRKCSKKYQKDPPSSSDSLLHKKQDFVSLILSTSFSVRAPSVFKYIFAFIGLKSYGKTDKLTDNMLYMYRYSNI